MTRSGLDRLLSSLALCLAVSMPAWAETASSGEASASASAQAEPAKDPRCAVWARELGFAQSVADHDAQAFAEFVHADAVFGVSGQPTRGREAIAAQWAGLIAGTRLELRWYPDVVSIGGDGRTAYSSGPALYRSVKDGSYRKGRFGSVWQLDRDGQWRVIFDDGIEPVATDAAGVQAFEAGRRPVCPPAA